MSGSRHQVTPAALLSPEAPRIHILTGGASDTCDFMWSLERSTASRVVARGIRGSKCRTVERMFDEFAAALQFPYYFGENWPAFNDCVTDLEWLPADAYVIFVFDAMQLLQDEPLVELGVLLKILSAAGEEWGQSHEDDEQWPRPAKAFHVVLQCAKEDESQLNAKLESAAAEVMRL